MATSHNPVKINPGCRGSKTIFVSKKFRETTEHMQFQVSHYALYRPRLLGDKYQIHLTDSDAASIKTVELLLRCLNDISLPSEFFEVSIDEVWRVLTLVDITAPQYSRAGKFNVPCNVLFDWFESWFGCNASGFTKRHQYEQLLYPTFVFGSDYFCDVTRWLVWNVNGQLQDRNPLMEDKNLSQSYGDMRLSKDVFHAVENSQAVLKNKILKLLDEYAERFKETPRPRRIQCWMHFADSELEPVKDILMSYSVNETLAAISIIFGPIFEKDSEDCCTCRTITNIRDQVFNGLCPSCMRLSMSESEGYLEAKYGHFKSRLNGEMKCEHWKARARKLPCFLEINRRLSLLK